MCYFEFLLHSRRFSASFWLTRSSNCCASDKSCSYGTRHCIWSLILDLGAVHAHGTEGRPTILYFMGWGDLGPHKFLVSQPHPSFLFVWKMYRGAHECIEINAFVIALSFFYSSTKSTENNKYLQNESPFIDQALQFYWSDKGLN